jgi:hypothetical protein
MLPYENTATGKRAIAVEVGLLTFEAAFLAQLVLPSGETVIERLERTDVPKIGSG